jgi:hypothetical protein
MYRWPYKYTVSNVVGAVGGMPVCGTVTLTCRCVYFQNVLSTGFTIINVLMEVFRRVRVSTQVLRSERG